MSHASAFLRVYHVGMRMVAHLQDLNEDTHALTS